MATSSSLEKLRWLFVSDFLDDPNSGAAGSLRCIGEALEELGHSVDFAWHVGDRRRLPGRFDTYFGLPRAQMRQVREHLQRGMTEGRPFDIVTISQPYGYLAQERLASEFPTTLFTNRTHGWEARYNENQRQFGWELPQGWTNRLFRYLSQRFMARICRRAALSCHGFIAPASSCARFVQERYKVPEWRVATIPYGLGNEFHNLPERPSRTNDSLRLLYVGQYLERKGSQILEEHLPRLGSQFPNARLTFVVPPHLLDVLVNRYGDSWGDRLQVFPWMSRRELIRVYQEHDIFLFPSYFEGFGKTFFEAMACGMCVASFDDAGVGDIAQEGEALVCPVGDVPNFVKLLTEALGGQHPVGVIGEKARRRALEFTWTKNAEQTVRFCQELRRRCLPVT
ncbi:MAG: glycosyltransferase family 4 protein [Gemmataceae bacterium]